MKINTDWNKFKNMGIGVFYCVLAVAVIYGLFSVMMFNEQGSLISDDQLEDVKELVESMHCEIEYKDFYYKGLCTDKEIILEYMQNMTSGACS